MKLAFAVSVVAVAVSATTPAIAGKVTLPKEGSYEFDFCPIGHGRTLSDPGGKIFEIHYDLDAIVRTTPPGRPFDRVGARCYGLYTNINGHQNEVGLCELTDLDGDKWWMDYHGNPDGAGELEASPPPLHQTERKAADRRSDHRRPRVDPVVGAETDVDRDAVDQHVHDLGDLGHQGHDRADGCADDQRQRDQMKLVAAQERADAYQETARSAAIDDMPNARVHGMPVCYVSESP